MSQFEAFVKALAGPFEEFVTSDVVNAYLQTIGSPVTTEVLQDAVPHHFLIVSGYEEARGQWATAYQNQIRFGSQIYPAPGLDDPMVLTPNFFCGRNLQGELIEYRLGLVKDQEKFRLFPVILRKERQGTRALILENLCVVHFGIQVAPESAQVIGEVQELTTVQEFHSCLWNIDDYLRKANPQFQSDFDVAVWAAVEAFSGRIINQLLQTIAHHLLNRNLARAEQVFAEEAMGCLKKGELLHDWVIPQAEEIYGHHLVERVAFAIRNPTAVHPNQITTYLLNLGEFMEDSGDFTFLETLVNSDIDLFPALLSALENISAPFAEDKSVPFLLRTLQHALEVKPEDCPSFSITLFYPTLLHPDPHIQDEILKIFEEMPLGYYQRDDTEPEGRYIPLAYDKRLFDYFQELALIETGELELGPEEKECFREASIQRFIAAHEARLEQYIASCDTQRLIKLQSHPTPRFLMLCAYYVALSRKVPQINSTIIETFIASDTFYFRGKSRSFVQFHGHQLDPPNVLFYLTAKHAPYLFSSEVIQKIVGEVSQYQSRNPGNPGLFKNFGLFHFYHAIMIYQPQLVTQADLQTLFEKDADNALIFLAQIATQFPKFLETALDYIYRFITSYEASLEVLEQHESIENLERRASIIYFEQRVITSLKRLGTHNKLASRAIKKNEDKIDEIRAWRKNFNTSGSGSP